MIIDHIGFGVADFDKSKQFYIKCLAPLGITLLHEENDSVGFGKNHKAVYWFGPRHEPCQKMHVAFVAESRAQVDEFYQAALAAGGKDNGAPGIREIYHPTYYGAFVLDPDGHNIEAVCHNPE
jgi:catechol 2,3-dioxygenase-like lactoylglutathione lyase family enzyme